MVRVLIGHVLDVLKEIPDESIQCVVTSPPYWNLRDYGPKAVANWPEVEYSPMPGLPPTQVPAWQGQLGAEPTPEMYVGHLVLVFREVQRVLRKNGTVWLNIGDCYIGSGGMGYWVDRKKEGMSKIRAYESRRRVGGLKPKDLVGIPWRLAYALQADGWWLRSDIVWAKGNCLPESVKDRPVKSHEYVFLLAKSRKYFYDAEAIKEPLAKNSDVAYRNELRKGKQYNAKDPYRHNFPANFDITGKNRRSVWTINTVPYPGAHFSVFPPALVELCIKAGTSEYGCCPKCGAPWEKVVKRLHKKAKPLHDGEWEEKAKHMGITGADGRGGRLRVGLDTKTAEEKSPVYITTGWRPTCSCEGNDGSGRCVVLDPFAGSGTTLAVAKKLGRDAIGIDIVPEYRKLMERRLG